MYAIKKNNVIMYVIQKIIYIIGAFLVPPVAKNLPAMQETQV